MSTRLYTHDIFHQHITPPGHPERVDRLRVIEDALAADDFTHLSRVQAPRAADDAVLAAHPQNYLDRIKATAPDEGLARIDGDTIMSPQSFEAALHAVGAALAAVDDVFTGQAANAFVAARPPGHHAERDQAMGFCLFANAALAARHAQAAHGAERVAIVDWDVHHGNGTQDVVWNDPSIQFCSTHQMPLYPGTGAVNETGAGDSGHIVNTPLRPGDDGEDFKTAFRERVLPAVKNFSPDLIVISAGFDAHHRDPLAEINLVEDDFDWATGKIMEIADLCCGGRVVSLLEGGYDLVGLSQSVAAHVGRLMKG